MTLTREQIKEWNASVNSEDFNALCDLALSAFDMREQAANLAYGHSLVGQMIAERIRALPIPEGADQRGVQGGTCPAAGSTPAAPHHNAEKHPARDVAESHAPAPSEPGDGGVAPTLSAQGAAHQLPAEQVPAQAQRAAPSPVQHPEPAPAREPAELVQNLASLVRRLSYAVNRAEGRTKLVDESIAFLKKHELGGSVLRTDDNRRTPA